MFDFKLKYLKVLPCPGEVRAGDPRRTGEIPAALLARKAQPENKQARS